MTDPADRISLHEITQMLLAGIPAETLASIQSRIVGPNATVAELLAELRRTNSLIEDAGRVSLRPSPRAHPPAPTPENGLTIAYTPRGYVEAGRQLLREAAQRRRNA